MITTLRITSLLTAVAAVLVLGAVLGIDVIAIVGSFMAVLTIFADVFALGASVGLVWKREITVLLGILLILVGLRLRQKSV